MPSRAFDENPYLFVNFHTSFLSEGVGERY